MFVFQELASDSLQREIHQVLKDNKYQWTDFMVSLQSQQISCSILC